jgi:broad specificity phosphatase PhoE
MVPEFAYLDARGVGSMEGRDVRSVASLLSEMDSKSPDLRMERGTDGTPNESVADVFVRVRQLMSKLETQYFGEDIVVIAPDSDLLSVLECALCNEPLTDHRKFSYAPGELRKISPVIVPRNQPKRMELFTT